VPLDEGGTLSGHHSAYLGPEFSAAPRVPLSRMFLPIEISVEWDLRQGHFTWQDGNVVRHDAYDPSRFQPMDRHLTVLEWRVDLYCGNWRNLAMYCHDQITATSTVGPVTLSALCDLASSSLLFPSGIEEEPFYCEVEFRAVCRDTSPERRQSQEDCLWNVAPLSSTEAVQHGTVEFDFAYDGHGAYPVDGWVLRNQYPTPRARYSRAETTLRWVGVPAEAF